MRLPILILTVFILINLAVDTYIYIALKRRFKSKWPSRIHVFLSLALFAMIVTVICLPRRDCSNGMLQAIMWMLYTYIAFYLPKYLFTLIDLIANIPHLFKARRLKWLSIAGTVAAVAFFISLWWAALVNRFNIDVKEVTVEIDGLPSSFDGYRIAQFSDMHVGTFGNDTTFVSEFVDRVNSLKPDMIVFTGDIVNSKSDELPPFVKPFYRLSAPDGVYSILGNHDYGDYSSWPSEAYKRENLQWLKDMQREMGWRLLLNETEMLRRGNDSIALIGVENIGDPPFRVYGSLRQAYPNLTDSVTKVLLTHNPAHWVDSISSHTDVNIDLSLAGHTHAMQGEISGWSPAKYRYPTWGGLYSDDSKRHHLYVNIGSGTVGFPARLGATPEITLITLKKAKR